MAIYGATATAFSVPAHLVDPGRTDELRTLLSDALERHEIRNPPAAIVYDLAEDGAPRMRRVAGPGPSSPGGEWWSRLRLSDRQAAELTGELRALAARYGARADPAGKPYLLHLALAQLAPK